MNISKELFLSILAMDSYNRGYESGILGLGGENYKIGSATIGKDAEQLLDAGVAKAAGFYAIAYEITDDSIEGLANGQKVISYRGTDNPGSWSNLDPWSTTPGGDAWNGWSVGAGASIEQVS